MKYKENEWRGFRPLFNPTPFETIKNARDYLECSMKRGDSSLCPCCSQTVKLYPRKINSSMVRTLKMIERRGIVLTSELSKFLGGGDGSKLRYWGLIKLGLTEVRINNKPKTKRAWICTQDGIDFLFNNKKVPKRVLLYRDKVFGHSTRMVDIHDCVDEDFNFDDLMEPTNVSRNNWRPMPAYNTKGI